MPVNLTVHRNTKRREHAKRMRRGIKACADDAMDILQNDFSGYAVVAWSDTSRTVSWWDGRVEDLGAVQVEDHVGTIMRKHAIVRAAKRSMGDDTA